eukprot:1844580-Pyramimonas_sp.AAC.1
MTRSRGKRGVFPEAESCENSGGLVENQAHGPMGAELRLHVDPARLNRFSHTPATDEIMQGRRRPRTEAHVAFRIDGLALELTEKLAASKLSRRDIEASANNKAGATNGGACPNST